MVDTRVLEALEQGAVAAAPHVRRALLRELSDYRARSQREAAVLARGWEPWTPPDNIAFGLVEPVRRRWLWLGVWSVGFVAAVAVLVAGSFTNWPLLIAGSVGMVICGIGVGYQLGEEDSRFRTASPEQFGRAEARNGEYRLYCGTMPTTAWDKYQRDRGLFDYVYVASNDVGVFTQRRAWTVDPFLVGEIEGRCYLGACWDLGQELARAGEKLAEERRP